MSKITNLLNAYPLLSILIIGGITGFVVGIAVHPSWHIAVESGQVIAGQIEYPTDNPFYMYHLKVWSLLVQFCALLLRAGFSEIAVSMLISGVVGTLSFLAFSIVVYAISRNIFVSLLSPLFIYRLDYIGHGVMYPMKLMGSVDSFGIIGLLFMLLTVGLIGAGYFEIGFFLLGLSTAVHPPWGAWCFLIVVIVVFADHKNFKPRLPVIIKYFSAGLILCVLSFLYQKHLSANLPAIDSHLKKEYLFGFINNWDIHRQPYRFLSWGEFIGIFGALLSFSVLATKSCDHEAAFIFKVVLISFLISNIFSLATHIPKKNVPLFLLILMPGRYINFNNIILVPILLGLLNSSRDLTVGKIISAFFILTSFAMLTGFTLNLDLQSIGYNGLNFMEISKFFLLILTACVVLFVIFNRKIYHPIVQYRRLFRGVYLTGIIIILLFFAPVIYSGIAKFEQKKYYTYDRLLDDIVLKAASERKGILLTGPKFHRIQLLTRRPVLLDTASLDGLAYVPESGPWFNNILNKVYNMDVFIKPFKETTIDHIPFQVKYFWKKRTLNDWKKIREEFEVTDILTRADLRLDLPVIAENSSFILYSIPY